MKNGDTKKVLAASIYAVHQIGGFSGLICVSDRNRMIHEVDSFVILDDEDWNWSDYGYENNWIQPTWSGNGGLKREHVDKAIEILNQRK